MHGFVNYKGYTREDALTSVGPGWASLIHMVFDALATIKGQVKIVQVKEKWGGLRIYTDYINEQLDTAIRAAEHDSFTICEECGLPGKLRGGSWYRTLCDDHANGRNIVDMGDDDAS
jgi:hypothetical protein